MQITIVVYVMISYYEVFSSLETGEVPPHAISLSGKLKREVTKVIDDVLISHHGIPTLYDMLVMLLNRSELTRLHGQ
jgi:hypothetical protein